MLRILVELTGEAEYDKNEILDFTKELTTYIKKRFNRKLRDIDCEGSNENIYGWLVGFISLPSEYTEEVAALVSEWADHIGLGTEYRVEDMETPGKGTLCCDHSGVCEGCQFAFDGKKPCRIGCTEA